MQFRRWFNPDHPQTLQGATGLFYLNALIYLVDLLGGGAVALVISIFGFLASAYSGLALANDSKRGYQGAIGVAAVLTAATIVALVTGGGVGVLINLVFDVALLALLVHPQSRDYASTFFE